MAKNNQAPPTTIMDRSTAVAPTRKTRFKANVAIELSADKFPNGYKQNRIDIKALSQVQRKCVHSLMYGLMEDGATLENGTPVCNIGHAVQWMLEKLWANSDQLGFDNDE